MENVIRKKRMGGFAKAMLVTSSRANAVKYKKAFDDYLHKINSPYKAIVAFSGEIDGQTEANLNGFSSASIPKEFEKNEYRFLLVANKFQTGFDQPLLAYNVCGQKIRWCQCRSNFIKVKPKPPIKERHLSF